MDTTLQKIDQLAAELKALQPMKPEQQQKLDKKIRLEFNYNSNHMEGNTLTYGETELLLIFDKTTGNHELREYEEMKSHDLAFEMIKEWAADKERPLNEAAIKNLHEVLLVRPFWKEAITLDGQATRRLIEVGDYKKHPNSVRLQNGELFHYASVQETPIQMGELVSWYHSEANALHPVTLAAMLHYKLVAIHPFDDGNGRISRLLMNYALITHNLPPVVIQSADKKNYLFALNQADAGDYEPFIQYIAEQVVWSLELAIKAAKGENPEEQNDWQKKLSLLKKQETKGGEIISKNEQAVLDVIDNSVIAIYDKVVQVLSDYDELFAEKRMQFGDRSTARLIRKREQIVNLIVEDKSRYMDYIRFKYELNGYKRDGINTFYVDVELTWVFDQFKYYLYIDHNDQQKAETKLYNQFFSKDEIETIANIAATIIMNKIEERLSNNK